MDDEVTGRQSEPCSPQPSTSQETRNSDHEEQPEQPTTNCQEASTSSNPSSSMAPLMPFSMPVQQNVKFMKRKTQRDVKRYCSLCRQHGLLEETRGHSCSKRDCECLKCKLMRRRREIMTSQIRLRREQERVMERRFDGEISASSQHINHASTSPKQSPHCSTHITIEEAITAVYACQKCKNHGIMQSKKDHIKDCQFSTCECPLCSLIDSRRKVEICMKECQASEPSTSG
ncbi:unnamed protein product, partial [Mesorhabditis belari]|uniref:DM domain-containing protein n=1 Tax=Mesorhabditis belari TaxID=2138241 RepID=A0AAF3EFW6_9BILA